MKLKKSIYRTCLSLLTVFITSHAVQSQSTRLQGAWQGEGSSIIFTEGYVSYAKYNSDPAEFIFTFGGSYTASDESFTIQYEYHTTDPGLVGSSESIHYSAGDETLTINGMAYRQADSGDPGALEGAWLFSGRERDGVMSSRDTNVPRKTMKILSGTRFQWIAYNTETGEFFGTGGGRYTTINGKYTEMIDFFSRDNSRVGAELEFDFEIKDLTWHHKGLNSRGEPMYETWTKRK